MTRTLLALLALTLMIPAVSAQERRVRLFDYRSDAGKFRAKFPERPDVDSKELATGPGGVVAVPVTTVRATGPSKAVYAVSFADYPETYRTVPQKAVLDGVRKGLEGTDGKAIKDEETSLGSGDDKVVGREFRIEAGDNTVRVRVFLVDTRLYQVMVTGRKSAVDSRTADEFLKSFTLVR